MKLLYALRFLTILPIPYRQDEDMRQVARSSGYYPLAGLAIGTLLYGVARLSLLLFPAGAAAALVVALWAGITGGLHLDGLSDLADGLGGGRTPEQRLEIMKDSRVGAFGAITLVLSILLKWSFLTIILAPQMPLKLLIIAPAVARLSVLLAIPLYPTARPDGMGAFLKEHITWREPVVGTITTLLASWIILGIPGLILSTGAAGASIIGAVPVSRKLGGITGDVFGAIIERGEVIFLMAAAAGIELAGAELFHIPSFWG